MGLIPSLTSSNAPSLEERDIDEADILYAGTQNTSTRRGVTTELEDRGLEVAELSPQDLEELQASDLEDKTIFYRDKGFTKGVDEEEELGLYREMDRIDQAGVSMVNSARGSFISNNKALCKNQMEEALNGLWFAETPETYESVQGLAREVVGEQGINEDDLIVKKPEEGSRAKGIEFKQAGEVEEIEEGFTYEEYIPHESREEDMWDEVRDSRIWVLEGGDQIEVVDRDIDEDGPAATNIAQGGFYREDTMDYDIREEKTAERISDQLEMDVFAIDCIRRETEDGYKEIIPYEANSTAGTKVNNSEAMDANLYEEIADTIQQNHSETNEDNGLGLTLNSQPSSPTNAEGRRARPTV
jgi:glutathione synthase/RimK-type ligase-like ATP-grasp enzyme